MKNYIQYNQQLFSRWAPIYDGFELLLYGVRKSICQEIDSNNKTILDVATGTGSLAIALSRDAKEVVGIDLSEEMLAVANKKKVGNNLSFFAMDASKMTIQDNTFDIVTISLGLHDMPLDIRTLVLKEVRRVLKKGGKLYILEYDLPQNELLGAISSRFINTFESKYYLPFVQNDFAHYLQSNGFTIEKKTNYLMDHLQFLTLTC
ncbi:MAG: class I SAM-dependent methyltransferase [Chitinophagales bacterium]